MSKERELLLLALDFLDPRRWLDPSDQHALNVITRDIELLLAQPEQEPVAWMYDHQIEVGYDKYTGVNFVETCARNLESNNCINIRPLYLAPPTREPIEDGELEVWYSQHTWAMDKQEYMWGFRDAEKAHGIGENDE